MFVNRVAELASLQEHHEMAQRRSQLLVLYGRRRVGKTALARKFLESAGGAYLFVETKSEELVLRDAEDALGKALGYVPRIDSWEDLFELVFDRKLPFVMDEFQNLGAVNSAVFSKIQKIWDENSERPGVLFIAIGSYVGMMKKLFRDGKQPLFGRATGFVNLKPFSFSDTAAYLGAKGFSFEESINAYSVLGGVPRYLIEIGKGDDYLHRFFYSSSAPFREEGRNILILEFGSEHRGYFSVLEALGKGKTTPKEIADYAGMSIVSVSKYLGELMDEYEIVTRFHPVIDGNKKLVRYGIADNFFDFWFRFIYSSVSEIEMDPEEAYKKMETERKSFVGRKFEDVVRAAVLKHGPFRPKEIGAWWNRQGEEIDLVALDGKGKEILFVEVKWRGRPTGWEVVENLIRKSEMVRWMKENRNDRFLVVSRAGFTGKCIDRMEDEGVLHWDLRDVDEMLMKNVSK